MGVLRMTNDKNKNTHEGETATGDQNVSGHENGAETTSQAELSGPVDGLESATDQVKDKAHVLIEKAKETAGQAYEMATEKAASKLDEQKAAVTSGLASVAGSIKQVGESLRQTDEQTGVTEITAKYGDRLAGQIEQISNYFEHNDLRAIVSDVEDFARKNPAVFIGGAFALGILAARFLKSSKPAPASAKSSAASSRKSPGGKAAGDNIVSFDSGTPDKNATPARDSAKGAS